MLYGKLGVVRVITSQTLFRLLQFGYSEGLRDIVPLVLNPIKVNSLLKTVIYSDTKTTSPEQKKK